MNYYPRYPGDYLAKTIELSMVEDGAYTRLLDWYYSKEVPIPHARRHIIARATTAAERTAVDTVLGQFFERDGDGYRHTRADQEIAKASPRIKAAKENGAKGGRRPRQVAQQDHGTVSHTNPLGYRTDNPEEAHRVTHRVTQQASSPEPEPEEIQKTPPASPGGPEDSTAPPLQAGSEYGRIAGAIRRAGVPDAHPGALRFRALVDAGATAEEFLALVPKAIASGSSPFAYLVGAVEGERKRAKATADEVHRGPMPGAVDAERAEAERQAQKRREAVERAQRDAQLERERNDPEAKARIAAALQRTRDALVGKAAA